MIASEIPGVRNGHPVIEAVATRLYRGGDVDLTGLRWLREQGVRTIVCLKNEKDDSRKEIEDERAAARKLSLTFRETPMDSSGVWSYDDKRLIPTILTVITAGFATGKVFVHCHHGSDRTGLVIACYRVLQCSWTADRAIKEMKALGNKWYHFAMRDYVKQVERERGT